MIRIEPAGAEAALISFERPPSRLLSSSIIDFARRVEARLGAAVLDMIPGWDTLLIHYSLRRIDYPSLERLLGPMLSDWRELDTGQVRTARRHEMPVWYVGEDLAEVAEACGLSVEEVIERHAAGDYYVGAVGFVPGYAYLGGLDPLLVRPRRATPRTLVPAGSVAIAEHQTGIYPQALPGGWNLIGRCPTRLYDPSRWPPGRFEVGDAVRFYAIDENEFHALDGEWEMPVGRVK
ncbi:5-oxoprolinase subunit PxpB [Halotalea alkalilenta]|uniref:5-oxoprolinase subunit PxpB n=1 Tax=Halotalea alkalilenta TaxID=376489 RepID=UPI000480C755|nr:5-oxoprolinase subunit PxpB [Halotalea alkalilenta]